MGKNSKRNAQQQRQNKANGGGKGTAPLTQEEIWDDSALIRSWNDALQEYEVRLPWSEGSFSFEKSTSLIPSSSPFAERCTTNSSLA